MENENNFPFDHEFSNRRHILNFEINMFENQFYSFVSMILGLLNG